MTRTLRTSAQRRCFGLLALAALLAVEVGCTRRHYRDQADAQAGSLWGQFTRETRQPPVAPTIQISPASRMYDPFNPDRPPMPPDDPVSNTRMQWIDGKRAWRKWGRNGFTPVVDNQTWRSWLPYDEQGAVLLDLQGAVQVGYVHSRNYQRELEDLYLSALDVSFERFRFDAQFFGTNSTFYTADGARRGGGDSTTLATNSNFEVQKLYAGGGQLVADFANSIIWQFSGSDSNVNTSFLNFNFIQPLLRFGGRARILERLTVAERQLLANARLLQQYRQGFYAQVATGRSPGDGPARRSSPTAQTGVAPGLGLTVASGGDPGGYLGLLQNAQIIRNQESNVTTLRDSLERLQFEFEAGRISDKFQVDLARQALYQGQSRLLSLRADYQTRLDAYKVLLGLPPDLPVNISDPMLDQFLLVDPAVAQLTEQAGQIALEAHKPDYALTAADLDRLLNPQTGIRAEVDRQLASVNADYARLRDIVATRERQLVELGRRPELADGQDDPASPYSVQGFRDRTLRLGHDLKQLKHNLDLTWRQLEALATDLPNITPAASRDRLDRINPDLSSWLLALTLARARARVDAVVWQPVNISPVEALETARFNRRDWMNARAQLVDTWRLIEFNANALKAGFNVVLNGDVATVGDNPVDFRAATGRLRAGFEFDAPLTRLIERNVYRQSLIDYQQARRSYMLFEDTVSQSVRAILRTIELNQLNFEIRRSAILVAIQQVDLAREKLSRPLKPGEDAAKYGLERASIGRDLVSALNDLLSTQNEFLSVWVSYQVQRINLDLEMGTMQLDERGVWIDPGPIIGNAASGGAAGGPIGVEVSPELLPPETTDPPAPMPPDTEVLPPPIPRVDDGVPAAPPVLRPAT